MGRWTERGGRWSALRGWQKVVSVGGVLFVALLILGAITPSSKKSSPTGQSTSSKTTTASTAAERPAPAPRSHRARHQRRPAQGASAGSVRFGQQTKTSGCQPRGTLPDPACTPGSIITQATAARICVSGYTQAVRNVPTSLRAAVYAEYGIPSHIASQYEVDHLVALELGGSNSIANLWPEVSPGFGEKDAVENELHAAVCSGRMSLRTAQVRIAQDWRNAGVSVPTAGSRSFSPTSPRRPSSSAPAPSGSDATFCNTHSCIASFNSGRGSIVQCADGEWSHSGGLPGVCSQHGGPK